MHTVAYVMTLLGAVLLYLTHHNQMLLAQALGQSFRWMGMGIVLISLVVLYLVLPKAVAILTWLIVLIAVWSFMPFLGLIQQKKVKHEY